MHRAWNYSLFGFNSRYFDAVTHLRHGDQKIDVTLVINFALIHPGSFAQIQGNYVTPKC